jgi:hypothetical protein
MLTTGSSVAMSTRSCRSYEKNYHYTYSEHQSTNDLPVHLFLPTLLHLLSPASAETPSIQVTTNKTENSQALLLTCTSTNTTVSKMELMVKVNHFRVRFGNSQSHLNLQRQGCMLVENTKVATCSFTRPNN